MTLRTQFITTVLTLLLSVIGFATSARANEPPPDTAKSALSKRTYPWYDAKNDSFRPLQPPREIDDRQPSKDNSYLSFGQSAGPILLVVMWIILGVAILSVLVLIARSMGVIDPQIHNDRRPDEPVVDLETLDALPEPVRGVSDLLSTAERLAAQEAFAEAITFYFGWQLVQLDRQQWIEVQKGKTNRQYRREVSLTKPELNEVFGASIRLFEETFFGKLPVSRDAFEQVWADRDKFQANSRKGR
ncbi:DUF4129 domain-containing protein [Schlesneria paludicola]|uniref:DUF4129 domain-containing protein n=1 Tax=Schlesneria paludicola TaxID=360056 RepID=UPI00029A7934|nr:DUF4129 domain-containing protein [Schlesneria paludicola]